MYKSVRQCTTMNASDGLAPPVASILRAARDRQPPDGERVAVQARSFSAAIDEAEESGRVPIIAEVKPTSPTSEIQRSDDPQRLATAMVSGGAAAISVLTEPEHFGGSVEALTRVREAVDVPVLRKDFILHERQLDACAADLVLIIARFVDDLPGLLRAAEERGFQVLVEVHDDDELDDALAAGASIIGINNRDLAALEVDLETFERLGPRVPDEVTVVAESGISTPEHVRRMREAGADALLVGSALMAGDVKSRTERLVEATQ